MKIIVSGLVALFLLSALMALSGCAIVGVATRYPH